MLNKKVYGGCLIWPTLYIAICKVIYSIQYICYLFIYPSRFCKSLFLVGVSMFIFITMNECNAIYKEFSEETHCYHYIIRKVRDFSMLRKKNFLNVTLITPISALIIVCTVHRGYDLRLRLNFFCFA